MSFEAEYAAPETEAEEPDAAQIQAAGEAEEDEAGRFDPVKLEKHHRSTVRALKQEREARRELQARLEAVEHAHYQAAAGAEGPEPDPDKDPMAWIHWARNRFADFTAAQEQAWQAQEEERQAHQAISAIRERGAEDEAEFRAAHPDYDEAAAHFAQARVAELIDAGHDPQEAEAELHRELAGLVARAARSGLNAAELVYNLAGHRGFRVEGAGRRLRTIARGQAASRSLSQGGGRASDAPLDPGYVAGLSGGAFDKAFARLSAQQRRRG